MNKEDLRKIKEHKREEKLKEFKKEIYKVYKLIQEAMQENHDEIMVSTYNNHTNKIIPFYLYEGKNYFGDKEFYKINWHLIKKVKKLIKKYNIEVVGEDGDKR